MRIVSFCSLLFLISFLISFLLSLAGCGPQPDRPSAVQDKSAVGVFGGKDVGANDPLASLVVGLLDHGSGAKCTGTLIADDLVLTAGHCVNPKSRELSIVFSTSFKDKARMRKAKSFIQHPQYNPNRTDGADTFDLALVRFEGGIPEGHQKVELNSDFTELAQVNSLFVAVGYGNSNPYLGTGSGTLRTVQLPFRKIHSNTEFQTTQSSKGVCSGDSGGPLFKEINGSMIQVGVASRVAPRTLFCRDYAVYTRVDAYLEWIGKASQEAW